MRQGRSSVKHEIKEMEIDKLSSVSNSGKLKEEAHLSGAYIRSLVKQLTSSKTKDSSNNNMTNHPQKCLLVGSDGSSLGLSSEAAKTQPQPTQPQQHKKQVRRRLHTSRPYQERLLNMAEARREIVTALKFHRASMKQQQQQQQQHNQDQPPQPQPQPNPPLHFEQQESVKIKCRRNNHRIYSSSSSSSSSPSSSSSFAPNFSPYQAQNPYLWPHGHTIPALPFGGVVDHQTLANNFPLPNQALGLNLNFQDFTNIDLATANASASVYSSPSSAAGPSCGAGLHAAMDDDEIAEIKSLGEQHQIEWSDTMNLVTSAYWSKFLRPPQDHDHRHHHDGLIDHHDHYPFDDQVLEFPSWLSANECHHYFDDDYFNSPSLPRMDIGEIDGMDGDWLA